MASFKRLDIAAFSTQTLKPFSDKQYWKNFEFPITVKEFTAIDFIDVSPVEPYYIAVTAGPKIDIYHQQTAQVWRSMTRFMRTAYGGKFRQDGNLLIGGSEEAQVKVFDYRQKHLLRVFKGHKGPVHRVGFMSGKPQVVSFSDDKSSILWDLAGEKEVLNLQEHTDFIRAGTTSPTSEHILISGSYDHTVKIWDTRTATSILTLNHGSPIESLLCYPSGSVIASAGGTELKVWDMVAGKLLTSLSHHHKTITSVVLATDNSRLLSGSLDKHVKVYDINTYSVLHTMDYPASVLSLGVAPNDSTVAVGMISGRSGLLSFQQKRTVGKSSSDETATLQPFIASFGEVTAAEPLERQKMAKYDNLMRKFQFSKALKIVMDSFKTTKTPNVTVAVLRELIRRDALRSAIIGQPSKVTNALFKFVITNIRTPNFTYIVLEVANTLIDVYGDEISENPRLFGQFQRLIKQVEADVLLTREHVALLGSLEMFSTFSSKSISDKEMPLGTLQSDEKNTDEANPLQNTKNNVVIDVS